MCTVTFIPQGNNNFILTSNRDEAIGRKTLPPDFYDIEDTKMLFPRDAVAGGSWIGLSEKSRLICLLNGGFKKHLRQNLYRMSRGVIVKELLKTPDLTAIIYDFDYTGVEPFTIIAISWEKTLEVTELIWDGEQAHIRTLDERPHIWSSSTLYDETMKGKRRDWFSGFIEEGNISSMEDMYTFHTKAGEGDPNVDVCLDRGLLKTVSITQVSKQDEQCDMRYHDLLKNEVYNTGFEMITA